MTFRTKFIYSLLTAIAIAVVGVYVVTAVGVYAFQWRGPKTTAWTKYVPIPVANVGWHLLSVHTLLVQYQSTTHKADALTATSRVAFPPQSANNNLSSAASKMIRDAALASALRQAHIQVRPADVEQAYQSQVAQTGGAANMTSVIQQLYGWTPAQFKQYVMWSVVAQDKLQEHLSFEAKLNHSAEQQAQAVLKLVQTGKQSFAELARTYSDDAHGAQGGDMGFVPRGALVSEVDDAAFSLPLNQTSDLLHSKYGWHIIRVTERKTENGVDEAHIYEIFISAPSVDQYLDSRLRSQPVAFWLPRFAWDAHQAQVVVR